MLLKKLGIACLTVVFLFGCGSACFAENKASEILKIKAKIAFYNEKTSKIEGYIKELEAKYEDAKKRNDKNNIDIIFKQVRKQYARITEIKNYIATEQSLLAKLEPPPLPLTPESLARYFTLGGGLQGGAAAASAGYLFQLDKRLSLKPDLGFGSGRNYTVAIFRGISYYALIRNFTTGISIDYAGYSNRVRNIPGLAAEIESGSKIGLGVVAGRSFGKWGAEIGYSTALGLIVTANYQL